VVPETLRNAVLSGELGRSVSVSVSVSVSRGI
jgi:hypothetical protein